jgi:hypothetical protein
MRDPRLAEIELLAELERDGEHEYAPNHDDKNSG